jgi:hypothetical protein
MPMVVSCSCGKQLRVKDELAGKKVRCPGCQAILSVPASAPAAAEPVAALPTPAVRRPPRRQIVLRVIVLVLGILGGGVSGIFGFKAYSNTHDPEQITAAEHNREFIKIAEKAGATDPLLEKTRKEVDRFERNAIACYFLLAGGLLGIAGGVLAFYRWGKLAALFMIVPAVGAAVVQPPAAILTSPLILSGILSALVKRPPRTNAVQPRVKRGEAA